MAVATPAKAVSTSLSIELTNTSEDQFSIDVDAVDEMKESIFEDINNIIKDLDAVQTAYKKLQNNSTTKGSWKNTTTAAVKKCKEYKANLETAKKSLESKMTASVLEYVVTQIQELKNVEKTAEQMKTEA